MTASSVSSDVEALLQKTSTIRATFIGLYRAKSTGQLRL